MNKGKRPKLKCGNCGKPLGGKFNGWLQMHADGLVHCNVRDFSDHRTASE